MQTITAAQFHEAGGVDDWRVLYRGATACFDSRDFATGARLTARIAEIADAANHHPDVDLRYRGVTVRTRTHSADGLTMKDVELARAVSAAARELGIPADPAQVQQLQLAVTTRDAAGIRPFWQAVLGYRETPHGSLLDPHGRGLPVWFQEIDRDLRGRTHIDVSMPRDVADARVAAALAAGGRLADDNEAPAWWTLADADGHKVDIAAWPDFYAGGEDDE